MMITRKIKCRKCGKECEILLPDKLSQDGVYLISLCADCLEMEIQIQEAKYKLPPDDD